MSKIVKVVAVVAIAAIIVIAAPYIAAFIAPALGSISAGLTVATLTSTIVGMGISLGLGALATMFRKTPDMSNALVQRLQTTVDPTAPRKIIFGETAAGADVRFQETHDLPSTKKDGFSQVVALASHRIHSIEEWWLDEQLSWANGAIQGEYADAIKLFRPVLEGQSNAGIPITGTLWNSALHSFTGCAYYQCTFKLDYDVLSEGQPSKRITKVKGCPLYDPRLDSTNGGSGPHRPDNNSTWAYLDGSKEIGRNPALCLLTYMIGWRINGKLVWGMGLPVHRIKLSNFAFYANLCEEQVAAKGGGTVQRYSCDGAFSTNDAHQTVISGVTAAMGSCILTDTGGVYQLIGGYDDTAEPTISFTADDLIGPTEWRAVPPPRERFNCVKGRYIDPDNQYQLNDWGELVTDPLPDGYDRVMTLELGCVSRPETAQRIAKQFIVREAKTPGLFEGVFGPRGFLVEVGSLCTISGHRSWNNKLFRVIKQTEAHDMVYQMTLREESPEVYAWDKDEEKALPAQIRPPAWNPADTIDPANLQLSTEALPAGDGQNYRAFLTISWTPEESGRVRTIQIRAKALGQSDWSALTDRYDPKAGFYQTASSLPGVAVQIEARFQMSTGVFGNWVAANIVAENDTIVDGPARDAADAAQDTADEANDKADDAIDGVVQLVVKENSAIALIEEIRGVQLDANDIFKDSLDLLASDTQAKVDELRFGLDETGTYVQTLTTTLVNKANLNTAIFNQKITTLTDADTAISGVVTNLATETEDSISAINDELISISGPDGAIASAVQELAAQTETEIGLAVQSAVEQAANATTTAVGDATAEITDTISASLVGIGGVTMQEKLSVVASATTGFEASWTNAVDINGRVTGLASHATGTTTDFVIIADRITFADPDDPTNANQAFDYRDGILYLENVYADNANFKNLTLAGVKMEPSALSTKAYATGNLNGYHSSSTAWTAVGGSGGPIRASIQTGPAPTGTTNVVEVRVTVTYERDGGDDDNLQVRLERQTPSGFAYFQGPYNVQVQGGKRQAIFSFIDPSADPDVTNIYTFQQAMVPGDGSPYWYDYVIVADCSKGQAN